ncbi:hypothetical protein KEJ37_06945 [Candidatus Bathyarchaeota archaeon]|nr:hypothetical protein [Candidatus Bathyarchaeota archaeon]
MGIGDLVMMVTLAIIIVAAVLILGNFQNAIGALGLTGVANTTATQAIANAFTGLQLAAIGIIVLAAVGIIAFIIGAFGGLGGARRGT